MSKEKLNMFALCDKVIDVIVNTKTVDQKVLNDIETVVSRIDKDFIKSRHASEELKNMLKRFKEGDFKKACHHAKKFKNKTRIYSNDLPFKKGDIVAVMRTEHGWYNGKMRAKIVEPMINEKGVWSYKAIVCPDGDYAALSGYMITIDHTRDACAY